MKPELSTLAGKPRDFHKERFLLFLSFCVMVFEMKVRPLSTHKRISFAVHDKLENLDRNKQGKERKYSKQKVLCDDKTGPWVTQGALGHIPAGHQS